MVKITLPDNSTKNFDSSISIDDVAAEIGKGLFKATVAGKVDGTLKDEIVLWKLLEMLIKME